MAEYIEREAAITELNLWSGKPYGWGKAVIERVPAADVAPVARWIPVTERLPEEDEVVLVWGGASVYTAKRYNKYGGVMWWKLNSKQHYCNPTHWMPLPKPPKEVSE